MCGMMAIGLIGGVVSAMGAIAQANAQAQALKDQAAWEERQAAVEQTKTAYEIAQQRRQTEAALGQIQVGYSAGGIQTGGGTPEQVGQSVTQEREMDVQATRFKGGEEVAKFQWDAQQHKKQASAVKTAGMFNAMSSIIGSIGSLGGSGTSMGGAFSTGQMQGPVMGPAIATVPPPVASAVSGGGSVAPVKMKFPVFGGFGM